MDNPGALGQIRALEERGRRVPDRLIPPEILPGYDDWLEAFIELGTDRQIGQIMGPIPAASIDRHVSGWSDDEQIVFRRVIRALDAVYLERQVPGSDVELPASDNPARDAFRAKMR